MTQVFDIYFDFYSTVQLCSYYNTKDVNHYTQHKRSKGKKDNSSCVATAETTATHHSNNLKRFKEYTIILKFSKNSFC